MENNNNKDNQINSENKEKKKYNIKTYNISSRKGYSKK